MSDTVQPPDPYLERRERRRAADQLARVLVLGYLVSFVLLLGGAWSVYARMDAWDGLWRAVMVVGAAGVVATLVLPHLWLLPERALHAFGNRVGQALFVALLTLAYFLLVTPVGWLMRRRPGANPITRWGSGPRPAQASRWVPFVALAPGSGRRRTGLLAVVGFFIARGHYILLPLILILASLGLALFFVQSSVLAPFIYTLF